MFLINFCNLEPRLTKHSFTRITIRDRIIGITFLDTGADISTTPVTRRDRLSDRVLYAVNGTIIPTYGQKLLQLDFAAFFDGHL